MWVIMSRTENRLIKREHGSRSAESLKEYKIRQDTWLDFMSRNETFEVLGNRFETPIKTALLSEQEATEIFEKGDSWKSFYKKFPKAEGYVEFSRVGFSKDGRQAVVEVGRRMGFLAGRGDLYVLEKTGNKWTIVNGMEGIWISSRPAAEVLPLLGRLCPSVHVSAENADQREESEEASPGP
jgi:hypothetical protein